MIEKRISIQSVGVRLMWTAVLFFVLAALLAAPRPAARLLGCVTTAVVLYLLVTLLKMRRDWLHADGGRPPGIPAFLWGNLPQFLMQGGMALGLGALVVRTRLTVPEDARDILTQVLVTSVTLVVAGLGLHSARDPGAHARMARELPRKPVRQLMREAVAFQRRSLRGSTFTFFRLHALTLVIALAGIAAGAGLVWLGLWLAGGWSLPLLFVPPALVQIGVALGFFVLFFAATADCLTVCRVVARSREEETFTRRWLWRELDTAIGTLGIFATILVSVLVLGLLAGFGFAGYRAYLLLVDQGIESLPAIIVSALLMMVAFGVLIAWPTQWFLPILVTHDCGWLRGVVTSSTLVGIERQRAFAIGCAALLLASTIFFLPAAAALLVASLDELAPVVALLLGSRTLRDANADAEARAAASAVGMPIALRRAHAALDEGRYMDALNGFQMFLRQYPEHPDAMRGEVIAYLHLGNPGLVREKLERWMMRQPDSEEAREYYGQFKAGRWSEGGDLYEDARRRGTEQVGSGVTIGHMLGRTELPAPPPADDVPRV